jgi:hypothetical protein
MLSLAAPLKKEIQLSEQNPTEISTIEVTTQTEKKALIK